MSKPDDERQKEAFHLAALSWLKLLAAVLASWAAYRQWHS